MTASEAAAAPRFIDARRVRHDTGSAPPASELSLVGDLLRSVADQRPVESILVELVDGAAGLTGGECLVVDVSAPEAVVPAGRLVVHHGLSAQEVGRWCRSRAAYPGPGADERRAVERVPYGSGGGARLLTSTIRVDGSPTGTLSGRWGRGVDPRRAELVVSTLANAVGLIVDTALERSRTTHQEQWLRSVVGVARLLASPGASEHALQAVCEGAMATSGADLAWIVARGSGGGLELAALSGLDDELADRVRASEGMLETSASARVIVTGRSVVDTGRTADGRSSREADWHWLGPALMTPATFTGEVEGMLGLGWSPERFEQFRGVGVELVRSFSEFTAMAIRVTRMREAAGRLSILEDREQLAHDLHDTVARRLQLVERMLGETGAVEGDPAVDLLRETAVELRRAVAGTGSRPPERDLLGQVRALLERSTPVLGFAPGLVAPTRPVPDLRAPVVDDVLAVLEEAVSNVSRHAGASACTVGLEVGARLTLSVADNGRGMASHVVEGGLRNLRTRAEAHGGELTVRSGPGGSTVSWSVPVAAPAAQEQDGSARRTPTAAQPPPPAPVPPPVRVVHVGGDRSDAGPALGDGLRLLDVTLRSVASRADPAEILGTVVSSVASATGAHSVVLEVPDEGAVLAGRMVLRWGREDETPRRGRETSRADSVAVRLADGTGGRLSATWRDRVARSSRRVLLDVVATAAALVVEDAARRTRSLHRQRWLETVVRVAALLSGPESGREAIQVVCESARLIAGADLAWVMTRTANGDFEHRAKVGFSPDQVEQLAGFDLSTSLSASAIRSGSRLSASGEAAQSLQPPSTVWRSLGPALLIPAPFNGAVEDMLGLAWANDRVEDFRAVDVALADSFAELTALVTGVARIQETSRRLSVLEERGRIARDLHDTVIQRLYAVGLMLSTQRRRTPRDRRHHVAAVRLLDEVIADLRRAITELVPAAGSGSGPGRPRAGLRDGAGGTPATQGVDWPLPDSLWRLREREPGSEDIPGSGLSSRR